MNEREKMWKLLQKGKLTIEQLCVVIIAATTVVYDGARLYLERKKLNMEKDTKKGDKSENKDKN